MNFTLASQTYGKLLLNFFFTTLLFGKYDCTYFPTSLFLGGVVGGFTTYNKDLFHILINFSWSCDNPCTILNWSRHLEECFSAVLCVRSSCTYCDLVTCRQRACHGRTFQTETVWCSCYQRCGSYMVDFKVLSRSWIPQLRTCNQTTSYLCQFQCSNRVFYIYELFPMICKFTIHSKFPIVLKANFLLKGRVTSNQNWSLFRSIISKYVYDI